jgi:hypothetical protein
VKGACFLLNGQMPLIVALRMRFNPVKPTQAGTHALGGVRRRKALMLTGACPQTLSEGQHDAATSAGTSIFTPIGGISLKNRHITQDARFYHLAGVPVPYRTGV